ncbi:MAG: hypothetical protein H6837_02815 [Planctomycetes bacterium]|nr:hypothetical protein [Planctomycetota bacterium]
MTHSLRTSWPLAPRLFARRAVFDPSRSSRRVGPKYGYEFAPLLRYST